MGRNRTVNIKRSKQLNKQINQSNAYILKLADPIVQFIIFIYFLYCLDSMVVQPSYRTVFLALVGWQYLSAIVNIIHNDSYALKIQRYLYLLINTAYMALFFYAEKHLTEQTFGLDEQDRPYIHLYQTILMGGGIIIAFWYNIICYREVKKLVAISNRSHD